MTEIDFNSGTITESIAMKRILEGLIHNINTPLNLILGYAQQLKKQHPELKSPQTILDAGLTIDDVLHSCMRQLDLRSTEGIERILLNDWLQDEVKLLKNVLEIKRNLSIDVVVPAHEVYISVHPLLLSIIVEVIVLSVVRNKPSGMDEYYLRLVLSDLPDRVEIRFGLPLDSSILKLGQKEIRNKVNAGCDFDISESASLRLETGDKNIVLTFMGKGI